MNINPIEKTDKPQTDKARDIKLRDMSKKMEAAFLIHVFKSLEKTIPKTSITGSSRNNLATMMFSTVMADAVSEQGGVGLGDQIYQSLKEMDELPDFEELKLDDISNTINTMEFMKTGFGK